MAKKFIHFTVSEPIYGTVLRVVIGGEWEELVKNHYSPTQAPPEPDGAEGRYWGAKKPNGKLQRHVWCSKFGAGLIAHEVFHAVFAIFQDKGMEHITYQNEEAFAYLLGYYTRTVVDRAYSLGADKLTQDTTS